MEVVGLCAACHRPGRLMGCPSCGQQVHPECLSSGVHAHGRMDPHGGRPPRGGNVPDHEKPKM